MFCIFNLKKGKKPRLLRVIKIQPQPHQCIYVLWLLHFYRLLNNHNYIRKFDVFHPDSKIMNYPFTILGFVTIHVSCKIITQQADWELSKPTVVHQNPLKPTEIVSHCHYTRDKTVNSLKKDQSIHSPITGHPQIHICIHPSWHSGPAFAQTFGTLIYLSSPSPTIIDACADSIPTGYRDITPRKRRSNLGLTETLRGQN